MDWIPRKRTARPETGLWLNEFGHCAMAFASSNITAIHRACTSTAECGIYLDDIKVVAGSPEWEQISWPMGISKLRSVPPGIDREFPVRNEHAPNRRFEQLARRCDCWVAAAMRFIGPGPALNTEHVPIVLVHCKAQWGPLVCGFLASSSPHSIQRRGALPPGPFTPRPRICCDGFCRHSGRSVNEVLAEFDRPDRQLREHDPWSKFICWRTHKSRRFVSRTMRATQWVFPSDAQLHPANPVDWLDGQPQQLRSVLQRVSAAAGGGPCFSRALSNSVQVGTISITRSPANLIYGDYPTAQPSIARRCINHAGSTTSAALPPISVSINEWMADMEHNCSIPATINMTIGSKSISSNSTAISLVIFD